MTHDGEADRLGIYVKREHLNHMNQLVSILVNVVLDGLQVAGRCLLRNV